MRAQGVALTAAGLLVFVLVAANFPSRHLAPGMRADRIVIRKSEHTLTLYSKGKALKMYRVALVRGDGSAKQRAGDHQTPEGFYGIDSRNQHSRFHKALHVSYPNAHDAQTAARLGVPAGGDIMLHGIERGLGWLGKLHRSVDWTDGCVAVTDAEIDELWDVVPSGTPIEIRH